MSILKAGDKQPFYDYLEFIEALVRCADVAWSEVRLMERSKRLRALVRSLLKQSTEEELLHEVLAQWAPPQYTPDPNTDQAAGETDLQFTVWRKVWKKIELRDLSGFTTWEGDVHRILHKNFLPLCAVFAYYCETNGSHDITRLSHLSLKPRSELGRPNPLARNPGKDQSSLMKLSGWLQLLHDTGLIGHSVYMIEEEDPNMKSAAAASSSSPVQYGRAPTPPPPTEDDINQLPRLVLQKSAGKLLANVVGREADGVDVPSLVEAVETLALTWRPADEVAAAAAEAAAAEEAAAKEAEKKNPTRPKTVVVAAPSAEPPQVAIKDKDPFARADGSKPSGTGDKKEGDGGGRKRRGPSRKGEVPTGARGRVKPKPKGYKPPPVVGGMLVETTAQKAERAKEMKAKVAAADAAAKKEKEAREAAREAARNGGGTDTEGEGAPTQAPAAEPAAAKDPPRTPVIRTICSAGSRCSSAKQPFWLVRRVWNAVSYSSQRL